MRTPRLPVVDWTDATSRFKWTRPFRVKTNSGFCVCVITFQLASTILCRTYCSSSVRLSQYVWHTLELYWNNVKWRLFVLGTKIIKVPKYMNQQIYRIKYSKTQIIGQNSWFLITTCFGIKVPSSVCLIKQKFICVSPLRRLLPKVRNRLTIIGCYWKLSGWHFGAETCRSWHLP